MKYEKSIKSLIKGRRSVRTFTDKKIEDVKTKMLTSIMDELSNENYRFLIMDLDFSEGTKLGTYGVIKGASTYILGIMKKSYADDKVMASSFGYTFEQIILKSSELDLGTCWMAGTFNKKDVENLITLNDDEHIVMISPIGYEKSKSTTEKLSRFLAKSDKRKPWEQLFFIENFEKAMTPKDAGRYKDALEMLRLAPSAINIQPWRVVKTDEGYDFYAVKSKLSDKDGKKIDITYNDIGIAKYHFESTLKEDEILGKWSYKNNNYIIHDKFEYVCTWK